MLKVAFSKINKLIITGHKGFVGSYLLDTFKEKENDFIIDELDNINLAQVSHIIHLASRVNNTIESLLSNIDIDFKIFTICQENDITLVYASGNNVYPFKELCTVSEPLNASDFYSSSKFLAEQWLKNNYTFKKYILRIGDVFGKNQRQGNFFKSVYKSVKEKNPIILYGEGSKERNYIYVKDLAYLLKHLITDYEEEGIYNVCYEKSYSLKKITEYVSEKYSLALNVVSYPSEDKTIRTMVPSKFKKFTYKYDTEKAIDDYLKE